MKLYVWEGVLTDYTDGIMFAVAPSVAEARKMLLKKCSYIPEKDLEQTPQEFDLTSSVAFYCWGGG